ncbi:MAG: FG-GAP-like repeat-containing protein [Nitrospira sp.]|nr:FG-GAP-like repeat-containing protein [Nitrospira sp.]
MPQIISISSQGSGDSPQLVVLAKREAGLRAGGADVASVTGADTSLLSSLLSSHDAVMHPMFGLSEDRTRAHVETLVESLQGDVTPNTQLVLDLPMFYRIAAPEDKLERLAEQLLANDLVEAAYVKPAGAPPAVAEAQQIQRLNDMQPDAADTPPVTPDFVANQGYLAVAPGGIDAPFAGTIPGGGGSGVKIIDCEWAWRFTHEDLLQNQGGVVAGTSMGNTDHGTAVLGVISGDRNSIGITGITPDATISASSFSDQSSAQAIKAAADKLGTGDIILLEIHRPGPRTPNPQQGQLGFIAIEWWPDDFAAIRYAVLKGIIVVEAAGNGFQDLDDPIYSTRPTGFPASWTNPFDTSNPSSGAVMVGAGAPPAGTHGRDHGPDRSRLDFSNYGARVDVQGWGREVTTTGYGDLQGGSNQDLWYTNQFSGTSSASPVVVGALAATQGVLRARGHRRLNSASARLLVRACGSPQQDAPGRPASQRIGTRPNLRELIPEAARYQSRSADYNGDRRAEILITSPWGMGILEQAGSWMNAPTMAPNGTRFGGWLLNTADNHFGPAGDYDGDGHAEILVASPWGIGVLKQSSATMTSPMMAPNGTRFGGWLLNTGDNSFGPAGDFDGDGKAELLVASPWGLGVLKLAGTTLNAPMMAPNGTRFGGWLLNTGDNSFGPIGDFDGDGQAEILVTSPWGIGVMKLSGGTMTMAMMAPNGTRFGGWLLNTGDNSFGPVGDFDGDGRIEIVVTSPWGIGILKLSGDSFSVPMMAPNGTRFGGWLLNTADNLFSRAGDFDGDHHAEILVTSPWGVGILKLAGNNLAAPMMAPNGTRFGGWLLNTGDNRLATCADYDADLRAEILVTSPWGIGILEQVGTTMAAPTMAPNGTRFGGWLLNTIDNDFGHGV